MSTQKNEHNPDKLRPETVGEGWRLLTKGEVQEIGDEWWYGGEWCRVHQDNVGRHYEFTTTRRRITPPTDTTGSGGEGETAETDELLRQLRDGSELENWCANDVSAFLKHARQLERQRDAAIAQVEALRRDGERLDWLETLLKKSKRYWPLVHINTLPSQMMIGACNTHHGNEAGLFTEPTLRAAIDSAQRQEGR